MDQTGINSAFFPPPLCPLEILSPTPHTSIETETQQPPTPAHIDNWHTLGFIYAVEEENTTDTPADISLESPTIPFDEDSPPCVNHLVNCCHPVKRLDKRRVLRHQSLKAMPMRRMILHVVPITRFRNLFYVNGKEKISMG
jgi:hypothetical protein